jgi:peptidoglycan/xylan/chitin deacetylase (PgdA/CDA1 family)
VELRWRDASQCEVAARQLVERLKLVPDVVREKCVDALPAALDVEIPAQAPTEYKAMDWDTVRGCERSGTTFGPHTVSHPILSQLDDARAEQEITESWHAVRDATAAAVPVFCYPNGGPRDFSAREERLAARAGMRAAVSGMEGCVHLDKHRRGSIDLFSLPRFAYSEQKPRFIQIASGIEALKARVRTPARLR